MFDEAVREAIGISGDEFIRRFDAGEYANIPDDLAHRDITEMTLLIPFGRADDRSEDTNSAEYDGDESAESDEYVDENPLLPEIVYVTPEEGRRMFDEATREWVGMSGEEFIRRWEAGERQCQMTWHIGDMLILS